MISDEIGQDIPGRELRDLTVLVFCIIRSDPDAAELEGMIFIQIKKDEYQAMYLPEVGIGVDDDPAPYWRPHFLYLDAKLDRVHDPIVGTVLDYLHFDRRRFIFNVFLDCDR
jgi:hypothetical protein